MLKSSPSVVAKPEIEDVPVVVAAGLLVGVEAAPAPDVFEGVSFIAPTLVLAAEGVPVDVVPVLVAPVSVPRSSITRLLNNHVLYNSPVPGMH